MNKNSAIKFTHTIQTCLTFFLVFTLPFFSPKVFADKFDLPKILFFYSIISLLAITLGLQILLQGKIKLPGKKISTSLAIFLLIFLLSTIFSVSRITSFFGFYGKYVNSLFHLIGLIVLFFTSCQIFSEKKKVLFLYPYLIASAFLVSGFGLFQFMNHFPDNNQIYRIRSTIGEPNRLAFFLIAIFPLSIVLFIKQKTIFRKITSGLALLLIFTTIILTYSRAAWISLAISLVICFLINHRQIRIKTFPHSLIIVFIVILSFLFWQRQTVSTRISDVASDLNTNTGSPSIRLNEWKTSLKISVNREKKHQYLLGSGPQTTYYSSLKHIKPNLSIPPNQRFWQTIIIRSQFLEYLVIIGPLGLLFFSIFIFLVLRHSVSLPLKNIYYQGFLYSWIVILISSIFYHQTIATSTLFWLIAGILCTQNKNTNIKKLSLLIGLILFSVGIICFFSTLFFAVGDYYASKKEYSKAIIINPYNCTYWQYYSLQSASIGKETRNFKLLKLSIETAQKAVKINDTSPQNLDALQNAYYINGLLANNPDYFNKAQETVQKWISIDPYNPVAYDSLGLILLAMDQKQSALLNFQKAISINPDHLSSYLHAGEALKQLGKTEQAIEYYQKAVSKNPNWNFAKKELEKTLLPSTY